jgi:hypothetical protein
LGGLPGNFINIIIFQSINPEFLGFGILVCFSKTSSGFPVLSSLYCCTRTEFPFLVMTNLSGLTVPAKGTFSCKTS